MNIKQFSKELQGLIDGEEVKLLFTANEFAGISKRALENEEDFA